jgi:hypothetical protein
MASVRPLRIVAVLEKAKAGEPIHDRNADGLRARRNGLLLGAPSVDGPNK